MLDHRRNLELMLLLGKLKTELEAGTATFMHYQEREDPAELRVRLKTYHVRSPKLGGFFIQQREPRSR